MSVTHNADGFVIGPDGFAESSADLLADFFAEHGDDPDEGDRRLARLDRRDQAGSRRRPSPPDRSTNRLSRTGQTSTPGAEIRTNATRISRTRAARVSTWTCSRVTRGIRTRI